MLSINTHLDVGVDTPAIAPHSLVGIALFLPPVRSTWPAYLQVGANPILNDLIHWLVRFVVHNQHLKKFKIKTTPFVNIQFNGNNNKTYQVGSIRLMMKTIVVAPAALDWFVPSLLPVLLASQVQEERQDFLVPFQVEKDSRCFHSRLLVFEAGREMFWGVLNLNEKSMFPNTRN